MAEKREILIVDDDENILASIKTLLMFDGYDCKNALYGNAGLALARNNHFSAILLDLGLEDIDGVEVYRELTEMNKAPVIVITARTNEDIFVRWLKIGGSNYLKKPFQRDELIAVIENSIKRFRENPELKIPELPVKETEPQKSANTYSSGEIFIDFDKYKFTKRGKNLSVTGAMFEILKILTEKEGQVVTHEELNIRDWENPKDKHLNLRVWIKLMREIIEDNPDEPQIIITHHGKGYRFNPE